MTRSFLLLDAKDIEGYADARQAAPSSELEATTPVMANAFANCPLARDGEPLLVIAEDKRQIVEGFCASLPIPFRANGRIHTVHWLGSAFMTEDLRGTQAFEQLVRTYLQTSRDFATAGSSPSALRFAKRLGFVQVSLPAPPLLGFARLAPTLLLPGKIGSKLARLLLDRKSTRLNSSH